MQQTPGRGSLMAAMRMTALLIFAVPFMAACGGPNLFGTADINTKTKFSSSEYGVSASRRVTRSRKVPKGGGRYQVGKPYKVAGRWYKPRHDENYDNTGLASWYGPNFHGRETANGEIFDQYALSAAHPTLPLPSYVRVTNLENNRSIVVRVNDRGPFAHGREIDLSQRTAEMLGFINKGTARVRVKYVGKAPLEGDDTRVLMASFNAPTRMERGRSNNIRVATAPVPKFRTRQPAPQLFAQRLSRQRSSQPGILVSSQGFNIVNRTVGNANGLGPLFYAPQPEKSVDVNFIDNAFAAAEAMATRSTDLRSWQAATDQDARALRLELGVFAEKTNIDRVAQAFALLGAVDRDPVQLLGKEATRLTLSHLKPGATRKDAVELAHRLGLRDVILY